MANSPGLRPRPRRGATVSPALYDPSPLDQLIPILTEPLPSGIGVGIGFPVPGGYPDQTPTLGSDPGSGGLADGGTNPYNTLGGRGCRTSPYERMAGANTATDAGGGAGSSTNPGLVDIDQSCKQYESQDGSRIWGWDKNGGYSYGPYQLAEKTGMLGVFTNQYPQFDNMTPGSPEFEYMWRAMSTDPAFIKAQKDFVDYANYQPFRDKLIREYGINPDGNTSLGLAAYSIANQVGGSYGPKLIDAALQDYKDYRAQGKPLPSGEELADKLLNERARLNSDGKLAYFPHATDKEKNNLIRRFAEEKASIFANKDKMLNPASLPRR